MFTGTGKCLIRPPIHWPLPRPDSFSSVCTYVGTKISTSRLHCRERSCMHPKTPMGVLRVPLPQAERSASISSNVSEIRDDKEHHMLGSNASAPKH